jgi:hypothetical protein
MEEKHTLMGHYALPLTTVRGELGEANILGPRVLGVDGPWWVVTCDERRRPLYEGPDEDKARQAFARACALVWAD